jgi:hypothetical protein
MADDIKKINDQINKLRAELGKDPLTPFDIADLEKAKSLLSGLGAEIREMASDLNYVSKSFKDSVNELANQKNYLSDARKSLNGIASIAQKVTEYRKGESSLNEKQLKNLQSQAKAKFEELRAITQSGNLSKENQKEVKKALEEQENFNNALEKTIGYQNQVNKEIGLLGTGIEGVAKALSKLGFSNLSQPLADAIEKTKNARLQTKLNNDEIAKTTTEISAQNKNQLSEAQLREGFGGKELKELQLKKDFLKSQNVELSGQTSKYKNIAKALKDQFTQANLVDFALNNLVNALISSDAAASDMAKSLNMSYKEALATRRELTAMASATGNNFVNTKGMQESLMAINTSLGTNVMLSEDMLVQFTEMREMAGFTNEELQGIAAISITTGKSMNDVTGEFMAQAKISALQNGVLLNEKDLLKDVGKISAATTLSLGKNPKLIGEAVATAKSLGMELSKVDAIAGSLLDFESSIASELEAELLLGRDINLEKARQAALNNDLATVAKEISDQIGSSAEFSKMNRIQQEALAKSVGMNREDLAQTLFVQEQLTGLTGEAAKEQEDLLNKRIQEVGLAQAQKELAKDGIEGLREQVGMADKFNATMEKVQELFVMLADPILLIADMLSPILEVVGFLVEKISEFKDIIGAVAIGFGAIQLINVAMKAPLLANLGVMLSQAAALASQAAAFAVANPFVALAGLAVAGTAYAYLSSKSEKAGDVMSPSSGKTMVSTKEGGLYELSKNDDLVAAPGAINKMKNGGSTTVIQQSPPPDNTESKRTNMLLEKIANQSPVFKIGTDEFYTATSKYSYQVQ